MKKMKDKTREKHTISKSIPEGNWKFNPPGNTAGKGFLSLDILTGVRLDKRLLKPDARVVVT
jgi:hypothetical protein